MRTLAALVAVLGLMAAGVAVSSPPKNGKHKIAPRPVAALSPTVKSNESASMPTFPAAGIVSPQGWIVRVQNATGQYAGMNGYQTAVARVLTARYVQTPTGIQIVPGDVELLAMHGSSSVGQNNMFQSTLRPECGLRITSGECYVTLKGAGVAVGQASGGGFTGRHQGSGGSFDVVVTAIP